MTEILKLYKNLGETPLECILRYKAEHKESEKVRMTYLGRLDPMAEGLLLVLAGDTRDKKKFLDMDKTYEFEVLWGFETDTFDTLGLVTSVGGMPQKLDLKMEKLLLSLAEKKSQTYPPFSSKVFRGDFLKVREGKVDELDLPTRSIKIFSIEHRNTKLLNSEEVLGEILRRVDLVSGDFRQEEIRKAWNKELGMMKGEKLFISQFVADVSSGTYIRSLAHEMGKILGTGAIALSIKRTRVGEYKL